jgi:hypothetical protein
MSPSRSRPTSSRFFHTTRKSFQSLADRPLRPSGAKSTFGVMARSLTFTHPTRGDDITVEAPPPDWV